MTNQSMKTLETEGTPWAEEYRGSGRLTGQLFAEPVTTDTGEVAPGWRYVGDYTADQFNDKFEWEQHFHCHGPSNRDLNCPYCIDQLASTAR